MKCKLKRNVFTLFEVFTCDFCPHKAEDEFIVIGGNIIAIYNLFDNCPNLDLDKGSLVYDLQKLKILLKDAMINQDKIFFCILEDFHLDNYYDAFEKILDEDLSIQIIVL